MANKVLLKGTPVKPIAQREAEEKATRVKAFKEARAAELAEKQTAADNHMVVIVLPPRSPMGTRYNGRGGEKKRFLQQWLN